MHINIWNITLLKKMEKQLNYNKKNPVISTGFFFTISLYLIKYYK
jgi:hypothetical protein